MNSYNTATPFIMHIDLNSCFATVEQQARVRLRGRPVAVVNRRTDLLGPHEIPAVPDSSRPARNHFSSVDVASTRSSSDKMLSGSAGYKSGTSEVSRGPSPMIVTASYEAKAAGVTMGMRLRDAKKVCPDLIGVESDPAKYKYVYHKLLDIMNDYSAHVTMKSIDEGTIDFSQAPKAIVDRGLEEIGREIKQRLRDEIGVAMRCNVGIGTNRFLAKTAANLHKPDGLDIITADNLRDMYATLKLTDLTGIAGRNEHRLNAVGIMTPLQFLDTTTKILRSMVFQSINGEYWHQRLRGWEVDDVETTIKRVGRQYVLDGFNLSFDQILQRLHHLCESVGQRMRKQGLSARGIYVGTRTWHASHVSQTPFFSNETIYSLAKQLFVNAPPNIRDINVHCYLLQREEPSQVSLFADQIARERHVTDAVDEINERYGEHTLHSADTTMTTDHMKTKIPFGSIRYL